VTATELDLDLSLDDWTHPADRDDLALLGLCAGPTIDVGCGPGRLTEALGALGHVVLGIDVTPEAVGHAVRRGGTALHRDVFSPLPGEGRWRTALLADGNIGIGGDPARLLRRLARLLDPMCGRVVAELAPPGTEPSTGRATLRDGGRVTFSFPWSVVGVDDLARLSEVAGFPRHTVHLFGRRWFAVLETSL